MKFKTSPITIGSNVWIGANTLILRGTHIGDNCVVAGGAVIRGSYPANTVIIQKRKPRSYISMEKPVRVLHMINSLHFGGSQAFIMSVYRNIDRTRLQFDFVVTPEEEKDLYEEVRKMGGRIFVCPKYTFINHFTYLKWWEHFSRNTRSIKSYMAMSEVHRPSTSR